MPRLLAAAAAALCLLACESEPPYQSQRCKELRARVRMIETLRAQLQTNAFAADQALVDAKVREWMQESPECFDPKL
jgi:hypothetical protein